MSETHRSIKLMTFQEIPWMNKCIRYHYSWITCRYRCFDWWNEDNKHTIPMKYLCLCSLNHFRYFHKNYICTYIHIHIHIHTHTFLWKVGTSHRRNGFYTVQTVCAIALHLPYTPKLSPHRRLCISTFPKKTSLCMIYKRFEKWGHGSMSWKVTFTL